VDVLPLYCGVRMPFCWRTNLKQHQIQVNLGRGGSIILRRRLCKDIWMGYSSKKRSLS